MTLTRDDRIREAANRWIVGGDTGISSKTIWAVMTGAVSRVPAGRPKGHFGVPLDPDDFGRCWRLLAVLPEWRERLPEVAAVFPEWGPLVREWDRLDSMFEQVIKSDEWDRQACKAMFDVMSELIQEGRE